MASITCYITIFIEVDVAQMKKLLLLVDRAYFEAYRDKYEMVFDKSVEVLRKRFTDEVYRYENLPQSLAVLKQEQ